MLDLAITFLWHRDDETTRRHHGLIVAHNPGVPVVAVDGRGRRWEDCDLAHLDAIGSVVPAARRYALLEWDCLVSGPLRDWYGPVWDLPASASIVVHAERGEGVGWEWWADAARLPPGMAAVGALPIAGMLLSRDAAIGVIGLMRRRPAPGVYCEVRMGSYLHAAGCSPVAFPPALSRTVRCSPGELPAGCRAAPLAHPVKLAESAA
jgi:hypothetical protein